MTPEQIIEAAAAKVAANKAAADAALEEVRGLERLLNHAIYTSGVIEEMAAISDRIEAFQFRRVSASEVELVVDWETVPAEGAESGEKRREVRVISTTTFFAQLLSNTIAFANNKAGEDLAALQSML